LLQKHFVKEHREQEEGKRVPVDNVVKDLINRDTLYRNEQRIQVEEKLKKAEINRKPDWMGFPQHIFISFLPLF
jgi:hypothetical protein